MGEKNKTKIKTPENSSLPHWDGYSKWYQTMEIMHKSLFDMGDHVETIKRTSCNKV